MALAATPADSRELLHAAFDPLAKDPGWHPEVRGLALVVAGIARDLSRDGDLAEYLAKVEGLEDRSGSLADLLPKAAVAGNGDGHA
jgi:hypothetical protein